MQEGEDGREQGDCIKCGAYANGAAEGSGSGTDCLCPEHSVSGNAVNGGTCACQVGYYMETGFEACLVCPVGSFSAETGTLDECTVCATDGTQTTVNTTTTSKDGCECITGYKKDASDSEGRCVQCVLGQWFESSNPDMPDGPEGICEPCPGIS